MGIRQLIVIAGVIALIAGVVALLVPVSVNGPDGSVGCGNGIAADTAAAQQKDESQLGNNPLIENTPIATDIVEGTAYVSQCNDALGSRRSWSIPLAVVGLLVAGGALLIRPGRSRV